MGKAMIRKQVYLTPELDTRLRREAIRQRRSEAEILREALASRLRVGDVTRAELSDDTLWDLVGSGASRSGDLSERVDELLYGAHRARR